MLGSQGMALFPPSLPRGHSHWMPASMLEAQLSAQGLWQVGRGAAAGAGGPLASPVCHSNSLL